MKCLQQFKALVCSFFSILGEKKSLGRQSAKEIDLYLHDT